MLKLRKIIFSLFHDFPQANFRLNLPPVPYLKIFFYILGYRKDPKYSDTRKIDIIILKFEPCGFTVE